MPNVNIFQIPQVVQLTQGGSVSISSSVNRTDFNLSKNVLNEIEFLLKDVDKKPVNLGTTTLVIVIVDKNGTLMMQKELVTINATKGWGRLALTAIDIQDWEPGYYTYSVLIQRNDATQVLAYTDQSRALSGSIELFQGPLPQPKAATVISSDYFLSNQIVTSPPLVYFVAEPFKGSSQVDNNYGHHTALIHFENFTGEFKIQASLENSVPLGDDEWFDLDDAQVEVTEYTGLKAIQFVGSLMWVRFIYYPALTNTGSVKKVSFKN